MFEASKKRQFLVVAEGRSYTEETELALRRVDRSVVTFHFSDGQSAVEHLSRCGNGYPVPDLLLLDRVLPSGPDGLAVLKLVRRMEPLARMPVIIVSGSDEKQEHVHEAKAAGADGFLVKPVQKDDYLEFARAICTWQPQEIRSESGPG